MWLDFLTLILLSRFSQRGSLVSGGGQWAGHVPRDCSMLNGISKRRRWARHLPGGWPDGGPWSSSENWMQRRAAPVHAPTPHLRVRGRWTESCRHVISVTLALHLHQRSSSCWTACGMWNCWKDVQQVIRMRPNVSYCRGFVICWGELQRLGGGVGSESGWICHCNFWGIYLGPCARVGSIYTCIRDLQELRFM